MRRFFFQVLVDQLKARLWRRIERQIGLEVAVAEAVADHEARRAVQQFQQELAAAGDPEAAAAVGEVLKAFDRPGGLPPLGADPLPAPALPAAAAEPAADKPPRPRSQKKSPPPAVQAGPLAPPPHYQETDPCA